MFVQKYDFNRLSQIQNRPLYSQNQHPKTDSESMESTIESINPQSLPIESKLYSTDVH